MPGPRTPKTKKDKQKKSGQSVAEAHPNPHGEQAVTDTAMETDHRDTSRENVAQTTNTTENYMQPSVSGGGEYLSTDSMFNEADPQTKEILAEDSADDRTAEEGPDKDTQRRKTA